MTELPGQHHDLAPVVALMRDEVCQDMRDVQRQVTPDVAFRRRHMAPRSHTEGEECFDPLAAPLKGGKQFRSRDLAAIDRGGKGDSVFLAERLDPHAPGVVEMPRDHADRAPRRSWNGRIPECAGQILDEVRGDPTVGPPGVQ
jgi:hypothetical protein